MRASEEVVGTQEAARRLGVSVRTVQLWVENGTLEAWKTPGGHRRILRSSLESALQSRASRPQQAEAEHLRVLIVEDDVTMQSYYMALFDILQPDAELTMAGDGFEGLVEIGKIAPTLMLVDVDMPGMDGVTMLNRIVDKNLGGELTIAVVTGLNAAEIEKRGRVPDGIPIYKKPLSIERLGELLQSVRPAPDSIASEGGRG